MKNAVFWDVAPCKSCEMSSSVLPPAHAGSLLADFSTLKMEAIRSSETSVHFIGSTRRHTLEDDIHRSVNIFSLQEMWVVFLVKLTYWFLSFFYVENLQLELPNLQGDREVAQKFISKMRSEFLRLLSESSTITWISEGRSLYFHQHIFVREKRNLTNEKERSENKFRMTDEQWVQSWVLRRARLHQC
jgi:hypothetical protein